MKIRCVVAYGVQENDIIDRKEAFWKYLDEDVQQADISGSGFILQFDGNLWAGNGIIPGDPNKGSHQKKKLRNFGHCPKLRDPPPPRLVWTHKVWTLSLGADPPPLPKFGHFDVKSLNVQDHGLRKFGSINFFFY